MYGQYMMDDTREKKNEILVTKNTRSTPTGRMKNNST